VSSAVSASAGYLFADSRVDEFPPDHSLVGLRIPQVPRHQFSARLQYSNPKFADLGVQFRAADSQFDDDRNQFRLAPFATVDLLVSRTIGRGASLFAAFENVTNTQVESGRTPLLTLGQPRTVRVGVRFRFK
jgi:outer membrane receptor protein involved in Fe transport